MKKVEGNIIDINRRKIFPGEIWIENGKIYSITEKSHKHYNHFISPGFIDAHVHIESSMLIPEEFSKLAIRRGTIAIVSDPHEIANVMGISGINFMLKNSHNSSIKSFFTIPSCVPSTPFDSAGSQISADDVEELANSGQFIGLSEMMNVPGVLLQNPEVMRKIEIARKYNFVIDGHAPLLTGKDLQKYIDAGISTDHECSVLLEAVEKISKGMKILIREGSAAKNYEALKDIISLYPDNVMFCTDDSHPGDLLVSGHIDKIVKRAVADGIDIFTVFKVACINPIRHYHLDVGMLQVGDPADFIVLKDLKDFGIESVYINGEEKYNSEFFEIENSNFSVSGYKSLNQFNCRKIEISQISKSVDNGVICIQTFENELITKKVFFSFPFPLLNLESDIDRDILKIVYLNRYHNSLPQIAYITGIGLKRGAFASSISHDSHNIIAVGCNDKDIARAINNIIENKGGLTVVDGDEILTLPLPIGGIMTVRTGEYVAEIWEQLIEKLKTMGCILNSPFMTLSFMSLIVIPELKIGEKGLFEFSIFDFISNE